MNPKVKHVYNPPHKKWIVPDPEGGFQVVHSFTRPHNAIDEAWEHFTHDMLHYLYTDHEGKLCLSEQYFDHLEEGCIKKKKVIPPPAHTTNVVEEKPATTNVVTEEVTLDLSREQVADIKANLDSYVDEQFKKIKAEIDKDEECRWQEFYGEMKKMSDQFLQFKKDCAEVMDKKIDLKSASLHSSETVRVEKEVLMKKWIVPDIEHKGQLKIVSCHDRPMDALAPADDRFTSEMEPYLKLLELHQTDGSREMTVQLDPQYHADKVRNALIQKGKGALTMHDLNPHAFFNSLKPHQRFFFSILGEENVRNPKPGLLGKITGFIFGIKSEF